MSAGATMPPIAAATGTIAIDTRRRVPAMNSCLSSSPATKKNRARNPSAAQVPSDRLR